MKIKWKRKLPRPELEQNKARSKQEDGETGDTEPQNLFKECGIRLRTTRTIMKAH